MEKKMNVNEMSDKMMEKLEEKMEKMNEMKIELSGKIDAILAAIKPRSSSTREGRSGAA